MRIPAMNRKPAATPKITTKIPWKRHPKVLIVGAGVGVAWDQCEATLCGVWGGSGGGLPCYCAGAGGGYTVTAALTPSWRLLQLS